MSLYPCILATRGLSPLLANVSSFPTVGCIANTSQPQTINAACMSPYSVSQYLELIEPVEKSQRQDGNRVEAQAAAGNSGGGSNRREG